MGEKVSFMGVLNDRVEEDEACSKRAVALLESRVKGICAEIEW